MDKHCRICHNISCSNHGKSVSFLGDGWKCNYIPVPTNADRIRTMSDEELTEFLSRGLKEQCDCCQLAVFDGACTETLCDDAMMKWLQRPAEGECL